MIGERRESLYAGGDASEPYRSSSTSLAAVPFGLRTLLSSRASRGRILRQTSWGNIFQVGRLGVGRNNSSCSHRGRRLVLRISISFLAGRTILILYHAVLSCCRYAA